MLKKTIVMSVLLCAVVVLGAAELARAQATETVTIRATGTLMGRSGDTLVVYVKEGRHLGMRRFSWKDMQDVKFYGRNGDEKQPHQLTIGSTLTVEYSESHEVPVVVTMTEVQEMDEVAEIEAEVAVAEAVVAMEEEEEMAMLPSTASSLPLVLMVGLMVLTVALTLTIVRRS